MGPSGRHPICPATEQGERRGAYDGAGLGTILPVRRLILTMCGLLAIAALMSPAVAKPAAGRLDSYVALGDSYTAGPLVPNPTGTPIDCGRSDHNYPALTARTLHLGHFRDVSCGSAETRNMTRPQTDLPLGGTNPPQFDALGPDVRIVSVGIGGNDVGFGDFISNCVRVLPPPLTHPCSPQYLAGGRDRASEAIAATAPRIAAVLDGIHQLAPSALVFLVGYPDILPERFNGCWPYVPILPADVAYFRSKEHELNAMLAAQAAAHRAHYVDTYTTSIGHDACQPPGVAWVNGAVVVPPSYPAHPNAMGLAGTARRLIADIRAATRGPAGS
jgi:lysophospholipase L1-like esterase